MRTPEETLAALDEIAARAEAAPGRPWYMIANGFGDGDLHVLSAQYEDAVLMSMGGDIPEEHRNAAAVFVVGAIKDVPDLVTLARTLQARLDEAQRERDAYRRAKAENDERFLGERDEARAKFADALTVLRWARISDHPMYGLGVNQGLSTDDEARAALGRIASNLAPHS